MPNDQDIQRLSWDLRQKRLDAGVTLRDAAKRIGISPSYLCLIEAGARVPGGPHISAIAEVYGWEDIDELRLVWDRQAEAIKEAVGKGKREQSRVLSFLWLCRTLNDEQWQHLLSIAEKLRKSNMEAGT